MRGNSAKRCIVNLSTALALSVLVAACGNPSGPVAPSQDGKVQLNPDSFNTASTEIAEGTELTVVLKDECLSSGPISSFIENKYEGRTPSGVRSYGWKAPRAMTSVELQELADRDECVENVASHLVITPGLDTEEAPMAEVLALPADPRVASAKHLSAIKAPEAYDTFYNSRSGIRGQQVIIAVIDSGVNINHEDLRSNIWINKDEIPNNGRDDDRNGYVDDVYGYNFASRTGSPMPQKSSANGRFWGHGTKVAGLAAASGNNGRGAAGVAYTAKIMALNNMGRNAGMSMADTTNAIYYAVDNGAHVINLSLGGFSAISADYKRAIQYALNHGVPVFAAAGNESTLINKNYSVAGQASSMPGVVSVGNFQAANYNKAPGSNYSTTYVLLGAPGTVTSYEQLFTTSPETNSSYTQFGGTSAATPVASGAAALAIGLLKARGYKYTAAQIASLILDSASHLSTLSRYFRNGNALNLANLARLIDQRFPARSHLALAPEADEIPET